MEKEVKFTAKGQVLGNYWGGGSGAYPTIKFTGATKEEILEKANAALNDGSMDSGMGYESLIGAILVVKETTKIVVDEKEFTNDEYEEISIGKLNDEQLQFLENCLAY